MITADNGSIPILSSCYPSLRCHIPIKTSTRTFPLYLASFGKLLVSNLPWFVRSWPGKVTRCLVTTKFTGAISAGKSSVCLTFRGWTWTINQTGLGRSEIEVLHPAGPAAPEAWKKKTDTIWKSRGEITQNVTKKNDQSIVKICALWWGFRHRSRSKKPIFESHVCWLRPCLTTRGALSNCSFMGDTSSFVTFPCCWVGWSENLKKQICNLFWLQEKHQNKTSFPLRILPRKSSYVSRDVEA